MFLIAYQLINQPLHDITEVRLKWALNTNQSINHEAAYNIYLFCNFP